MADDSGHLNWPVILNKSLEGSEIYRLLVQNHKVRVTDTTGEGVIIFPLSSVAFMIIELDKVLNSDQGESSVNPYIFDRIQRLNQLHRRAYVFLFAPQMEPKEMHALAALQRRFLGAKARFLPVHNVKACVDCMITLAKATCKPMTESIQERVKALQDSSVSDSIVLRIFASIGLSSHECLVLQHGLKTISRVSQATEEELMDCSLDHETAQKVINFFKKDSIQI
ncbi:protein SPO16 homolog [Montipora capricornis]|uniref:protein SPO16 homolog n=1 Tax=Montipora capricornis TaxID=246305 RepID=UPI0035F1C023